MIVVVLVVVLVLLGVVTKSAQVPFHFWLPQAMAAPTPACIHWSDPHEAFRVRGL